MLKDDWPENSVAQCPKKLTNEQGLYILQSYLKKFRTGSGNPEFDYDYEGKIRNFRFTKKIMVSDPDEREYFQAIFIDPCGKGVNIRGFMNRCSGIENITPFHVGCKRRY